MTRHRIYKSKSGSERTTLKRKDSERVNVQSLPNKEKTNTEKCTNVQLISYLGIDRQYYVMAVTGNS